MAEGHSCSNPNLETKGQLFRALWSSLATPTGVGVCKPSPRPHGERLQLTPGLSIVHRPLSGVSPKIALPKIRLESDFIVHN